MKNNPNVTQTVDGYTLIRKEIEYPYRVFGSSSRDVLNVILGTTVDDTNEFCSDSAHGFRISLHRPSELPRLPDGFIFIPIEYDVYISVKPSMMTTSMGLLNYSSEDRGCFFNWERQLRFFRSYNQENCELECLTNATMDACGCVKFSMPSKRC